MRRRHSTHACRRPARRALLEALRPTRIVGSDGAQRALPDGLPVEDGDALVVATSGTSGEPKGVVLTHDAVAASARATSSRLDIDPTPAHMARLPAARAHWWARRRDAFDRHRHTRRRPARIRRRDGRSLGSRREGDACVVGGDCPATTRPRRLRLRPPRRQPGAGRSSQERGGDLRHDRDGLGRRVRRPATRGGGDRLPTLVATFERR